MSVTLQAATLNEQPVLRQLYQLYMYDFSEFVGYPVSEHGYFWETETGGCFSDEWRHTYFIRDGGELAGFVIIDCHGQRPAGDPRRQDASEIAEYFVLRHHRRAGIGQQAAIQAFEQFPGRWIVQVMGENVGGQAFWKRVIGLYTGDAFEVGSAPDPSYHAGLRYTFDNRGKGL